jgi:hypothetical protein
MIIGVPAAATVIVSTKGLPVPLPFVAVSETVKVPLTVAVPLMTPVSVLIDNPAGNPVAE